MAEIVPADIALWKPFPNKGTTLLRRDIICVHTMVGSLPGSYSWASGAGRSYWHFGTSGTGECWQCQDLRFRSAANLQGNPYVIPIENADMGPGFGAWNGQCGHVPAFTAAQVNKLVQLIAYLCRRYSIPPVFIPDTQIGRRGIAWHRQGIPGWPEWQGGLLWSSSAGKCCPDNARIHQLKTVIVPRVRSLMNGDDDMAIEDGDIKKIVAAVWAYQVDEGTGTAKSTLRDARVISRRHELAAADRADRWIVKGDGGSSGQWYVTDFVTKRPINGHAQANLAVDLGVRAEAKSDGNWQPRIVPQAFLDQIPEPGAAAPAPPS